MQHDVFRHPVPRSRGRFPFVAVIQSDFAEGDERLVAPVMVDIGLIVTHRATPAVTIAGRSHLLLVSQMHPLHRRHLRLSLGSLATYRDDILRALDFLFTGL
jgi:toxin CcdB